MLPNETTNQKTNKIPNRVCIKTKDVMNIIGCSQRKARDMIKSIKEVYKKKDHQVVTIHEFSQYTDIPLEVVESFILY